MMKHFHLCILLATSLILPADAMAQYQLDSTQLDSSVVITGLDVPWEMVWGPDDWLWVTERFGRVSRIDPATGAMDTLIVISEVYQAFESGLLGMALHPNFWDTAWVYLVYTYMDVTIKEKLVRYEYDGYTLNNPFTIVDEIPGDNTHNGSRLLITPDRKLFMTTGDAHNESDVQDTTALNGKTFRFNLDGSVPADNPIAGSPVWSWGHRNHQGLFLSPNGRLYSSEHGPQNDDELNIIKKGRNYGWPDVQGFCDLPDEIAYCNQTPIEQPLVAWTPTIAPSDIFWYNHPAIPEWQNSLLMTVLKNKVLLQFRFNATGDSVVSTSSYFENQFGRLRDICVAPDGRIFLATNGVSWSNTDPFTHSIIQLKNPNYVGTTNIPTDNTDRWANIFPNPIDDSGMLNFAPQLLNSSFEIIDNNGKQLSTGSLNTASGQPLDASDWPSGIYFLKINTSGKPVVVRLIVLHP